MSYSFEMTEERVKKLKDDIINRRPDVVSLPSVTQKRKAADRLIKEFRKSGNLHNFYLQGVERGGIRDLELYDNKVVSDSSLPRSSVVIAGDPSSSPDVSLDSGKVRSKKVPKLVHFDPDVLLELDRHASEIDCSTSFLIRKAVDKYLKSFN